MNTTMNPLAERLVAEVMSPSMVTVSANATMAEAAEILRAHEVGGAPVVDEMGRCVGVLTWADFGRSTQPPDVDSGLSVAAGEFELGLDANTRMLRLEQTVDGIVRQYMSSAVQTIKRDQTLFEAAQTMCLGKIHRLIVLDESARPVGVVSALDVLGAIVTAAA